MNKLLALTLCAFCALGSIAFTGCHHHHHHHGGGDIRIAAPHRPAKPLTPPPPAPIHNHSKIKR